MAMNLNSNHGLQAAINMTPMIDVLLVLLIIFMAIAPSKSAGLDALVPQSSTAPEQRAPEAPVVLEIADDGSYRINTEPLSRALLGSRLTDIYARRSDRLLFVKAAPALEFSVVAEAIDVAHSVNIDRIGLMPRQ
jgi:biopolymer transport protein TolR